MKKITYNVFYTPVMKFIHKDGSITEPYLGLFENASDADLAIRLIYEIEPVLREYLCIKVSNDRKVEEKQILESKRVEYYKSLKEFASKDNFMKLYAEKAGYNKLNVLVDYELSRHSYMLNN